MQNTDENRRQSRRIAVRAMGYRATFSVKDDLVEAIVLDFSATGLRVEVPAAVSLPKKGALLYRDQLYTYEARYVTVVNNMKQYGLSTTSIVGQVDAVAAYRAINRGHSVEQAAAPIRTRQRLTSIAAWAFVSLGVSAICVCLWGHGISATDFQFQVLVGKASSSSIAQANARAKELSQMAQDLAKSLDSGPGSFSNFANINQSSTGKSNADRSANSQMPRQYDNVTFEDK
jgi:hypothetical protein